MRMRRSTRADHRPNFGMVAAVLDEAGSDHDMGINDILVDEGSAFDTGLKE